MKRLYQIASTTKFVEHGRSMYLLYGVFGILAVGITRDLRWLGLIIYAAGYLVWIWTRFTSPPFVVYLSTSDADSVDFHRQLQMLLRPLRAISLLDMEHGSAPPGRKSLDLDCLRTVVNEDWWPAITMLLQMASLVVINADKESAGVVREAFHIVREDIKYKTIFLTGGGAPLLEKLKAEVSIAAHLPGCFVARTPILEGVVAEILDRMELPSPSFSVWDLALSARLETEVWSGSQKGSMGSAYVRQTPFGTFVQNPYLNIVMTCPTTGKSVKTGVNSSYFEDWKGRPPKNGARFRCSECGQEHRFDNTNTWLERPS